jgi:hypothetical protein
MIRSITAAFRWAKAVDSDGTLAIAPPRARIWIIAVGELGEAIASRSVSTASSSRMSRKRERWTPWARFSASATIW